MLKNRPIITVIVPVYRVELYLKKCVDSILRQTYTNLEIILVNDGSPDNCEYICDEYAELDNRVKVIHQENQGLSMARNNGIDIATGEYITFIDSDDYIDEDMLEILYKLLIENKADISSCNCNIVTNRKDRKKITKVEIGVIKAKEAIVLLCEGNVIGETTCAKLYKKKIFAHVRYPKGQLCEDRHIIVDLLLLANQIVYTRAQKYSYVKHKNSITDSVTKEYLSGFYISEENKRRRIIDAYPELEQIAYKGYYKSLVEIASYMFVYGVEIDEYEIVMRIVKENITIILKTKDVNMKLKIFATMLYINENATKKLAQLYKNIYKKNKK